MAVAARPGPTDARVPCPLCGGLIHPVAGKCKHCKADVTGFQAARPAASTPLPPLHPGASPPHPLHPAANRYVDAAGAAQPGYAPTNRGANGAAPARANGAAAGPLPPAVHAVSLPYDPHAVLPQRPTTGQAEPERAWRSWPVVVIVLAIVAIAVAVVLMIWPDARRAVDPGKHALKPPPAPERMPTLPDIRPVPDRRTAPHAAPDPWAAKPDGAPQGRAPDPVPPADPPTQDDDALAPSGHRTLQFNGGGAFLVAMVEHMCRKMAQCGTDRFLPGGVCTGIPSPSPQPASCPAAARCLQHIDDMSCSTQITDLTQVSELMVQFSDCADAVHC